MVVHDKFCVCQPGRGAKTETRNVERGYRENQKV